LPWSFGHAYWSCIGYAKVVMASPRTWTWTCIPNPGHVKPWTCTIVSHRITTQRDRLDGACIPEGGSHRGFAVAASHWRKLGYVCMAAWALPIKPRYGVVLSEAQAYPTQYQDLHIKFMLSSAQSEGHYVELCSK